ncbi:MAG: DUF488 domain-containing protein [Candidatus Tectomicrobia bacterium]|uniref:DUF488 domain-containing protein n=1 Tax=Tectimicrobiota bacterium TaxID=2528274 RepID=A0A932CL00_UNCTE|nr:DUF488 domain-containing protein [Candidatus Tectomicrobia bacterium]
MILYTVGHGNATIDQFLDLLRQHHIDVLVDVRTQPYSRYASQFNRDPLRASLQQVGIQYLYLGDALGGRPADVQYFWADGKVNYDRLTKAPFYLEGLERLKKQAEGHRVAVLCSEADYRKCHRYWLITRSLVGEGVEVRHILHSGELAETRPDEFTPPVEQLRLF